MTQEQKDDLTNEIKRFLKIADKYPVKVDEYGVPINIDDTKVKKGRDAFAKAMELKMKRDNE